MHKYIQYTNVYLCIYMYMHTCIFHGNCHRGSYEYHDCACVSRLSIWLCLWGWPISTATYMHCDSGRDQTTSMILIVTFSQYLVTKSPQRRGSRRWRHQHCHERLKSILLYCDEQWPSVLFQACQFCNKELGLECSIAWPMAIGQSLQRR